MNIMSIYKDGGIQINQTGWDTNLNYITEGPVWSGLKFYVDSTDSGSYPGTGNFWTDLAQAIPMQAFGVQLPFTTISGVNAFSFNGSGAWLMQNSSNAGLVPISGDTTIVMWYFHRTQTGRRTVLEKNGTILNSYQQEIAVNLDTGNLITYYSRNSTDSGVLPNLIPNTWQQTAIKITNGTTTQPRTGYYSLNGTGWAQAYTSNTNTAIAPAGKLCIGSGFYGPVVSGYISSVMIYDRLLSDKEILRVYQSHKNKYLN